MKGLLSMDKEKLKLIVRNLELLVDSLKAEVHSDEGVHEKEKEYFNADDVYSD